VAKGHPGQHEGTALTESLLGPDDTLNALLDAEVDQLCDARRYEHTEARRDTRAAADQGRRDQAVDTEAEDADL
jgi:hypothetical protein